MKKSDPDYRDETVIGGKQAFHLYDTYGFPAELTEELAAERGLSVDKEGFGLCFKEHQEKSRALEKGQAKGGLESRSEQEIRQVENLVNEKIKEDIPVVYREMGLEEARKENFVGVFDSKYGETVKTYSIGEFSKEMCGGPHAKSTGELGRFRIVKEQSSSAGVRRIKAVLE